MSRIIDATDVGLPSHQNDTGKTSPTGTDGA